MPNHRSQTHYFVVVTKGCRMLQKISATFCVHGLPSYISQIYKLVEISQQSVVFLATNITKFRSLTAFYQSFYCLPLGDQSTSNHWAVVNQLSIKFQPLDEQSLTICHAVANLLRSRGAMIRNLQQNKAKRMLSHGYWSCCAEVVTPAKVGRGIGWTQSMQRSNTSPELAAVRTADALKQRKCDVIWDDCREEERVIADTRRAHAQAELCAPSVVTLLWGWPISFWRGKGSARSR